MLLPKRKMDIPADLRWNEKNIDSAVMQGILFGESIPKIAKRLQTVTNMNRAAAMRNARTAVTGAQNAAHLDASKEAEKLGIKVKKQWLATLDYRTRDSHAHLDGEIQELDDPFSNGLMYPGDPNGAPQEVYNCRCTLIDKIEDVTEIEPVYRRDNINDELIEDMSYDEWKEAKAAEAAQAANVAAQVTTPPAASATITDIVEQAVGAKRDVPIEVKKAAKGANPNYAPGTAYATNCQRCVVVYEFRRRGYDVVAKPKPSTGNTVHWGSELFEDRVPGVVEFGDGSPGA